MYRAAAKILGVSSLLIASSIVTTAPAEAKKYRFMCQGDHLHYGSSSGKRSRALAMRAAISDWAGFTAFEYGNHWAYWKYAKSKRVGCSRSGGGWGCSIQGTPCRLNR